MRWSRPARSAAVNFRLNGRVVWLYRSTKARGVALRWSRLAKSFGETTFFWMTEKKISVNGRLTSIPGAAIQLRPGAVGAD
jgi:hypothetical protein